MPAFQRFHIPAFQRFSVSAFLSILSPLAAQETLFNHEPDPKSKMRVEAVALFSTPPPNGFLPVRVTVNNPRDQEVELRFSTVSSDSIYGTNGSELNSSFTLKAAPGKTTRHDLLVPCTTLLSNGGSQSSVELRMSGDFGTNRGSISGDYVEDQPALLLSEPLYTPNASMLDSAADSHFSGRGGYRSSTTFSGKFDARELPEDWRAYSGYDGIGLTDTDWGNASPGARNAILRWNRLGGELVIHALSSSTDLSTLGIAPEAKGLRSADRSFGRITIVPAGSDLKLDAPATVARYFGSSRLPALGKSIRDDFGGSWQLQAEFGQQGYNYGLFILILVAFGIVVGPVNLFVFAKSGRRHRLFITTPVIALATSALLVLLIILIDGFGGRGMRAVLMEVRPDDGENSAYIYQEQISRTGVLLGGDFEIEDPALITAVPIASSQWSRLTQGNGGGGMRYEVLVEDGKLQVDGDWFQSRSEQGQFLRAVVPTRGRIEARGNAGPPTFVSTFEFPVETLFYRAPDGGLWRADKITPGKAFTCQEVMGTAIGEHTLFIRKATDSFTPRTRKAFAPLADRRGHFVALTTEAPGIATLEGIKWQTTRTYLTGPVARP